MLENRLPTQHHAGPLPELNPLSLPLNDDHHDGWSVSSLSSRSDSNPPPLIMESTTASEPDLSIMNSMSGVGPAPSVGSYGKDICGIEPISDFMQAEL